MALIVIDITDIPGEAEEEGYVGDLNAVAIQETLDAPLTSGVSRAFHSDIMVTRVRDKGSPLLAQRCAAGTALGTVTIRLIRTVENTNEVYMTYTLGTAYVSRYETDTADLAGVAYAPHFGSKGQPMASPRYGVASMVAPMGPSQLRLSPRPTVAQPIGPAGSIELERVWFNSATVKWTYSGGSTNVEAQWNIKGGSATMPD